MKKRVCIAVTVVACLLLAGCYEVKRTGGLSAACEKILLANSLADQLGERKDLTDDTLKPLIESYNNAALSVNLFLDVIVAESVKVVDVPFSAFYTNIASSDLDRFISDARAILRSGKDEKVDETEKTERQRKDIERLQNIRLEAHAKVRGILELNGQVYGKISGESYKRFKGLIDSLRMNVLPRQKP